jgi:hypothetical protein
VGVVRCPIGPGSDRPNAGTRVDAIFAIFAIFYDGDFEDRIFSRWRYGYNSQRHRVVNAAASAVRGIEYLDVT